MPGSMPIVVDAAGLMELPPRAWACVAGNTESRPSRPLGMAGHTARHSPTHTVMAVRRACLTLLDVCIQRCMVLETVREHVLKQLHAIYSFF